MNRFILSFAACALAAPAVSAQSAFTPENATTSSLSTYNAGPSAFYFVNSSESYAETYAWTSGARSFVETSSGTARLRGTIRDTKNSRRTFIVDGAFSGFVAANQPAPVGSPHTTGLKSSSLKKNNGPIDPDTWRYYTRFTVLLTGGGDMSGWRVRLTRRGPAFQVGVGANVYNGNLGASNWFNVEVLSKGSKSWNARATGDINIDLTPVCTKPTISRIANPTLAFVTSNCFRVSGANMRSVTDVRIGNKIIKSMNPNDFGTTGFFVIVDDSTICVYPPLCMEGSFRLSVRNSKCGDAYTGSAAIRLVAPRGNTMATAPRQDASAPWCAFLYGAYKNNYYCVFASPFNKPSSVANIIDLGIGDNFKLLIAFDSPGPKCYEWCIGTWGPVVKGMRLYFQTLVIDLDNLTRLPFTVTNVSSTLFR